MASMQGHPLREIAEDLGYSESTAHRRIKEARAHIMDDLASHAGDRPWVPLETGSDAVLQRAQHLFEQTSPPPFDLKPSRGPAR